MSSPGGRARLPDEGREGSVLHRSLGNPGLCDKSVEALSGLRLLSAFAEPLLRLLGSGVMPWGRISPERTDPWGLALLRVGRQGQKLSSFSQSGWGLFGEDLGGHSWIPGGHALGFREHPSFTDLRWYGGCPSTAPYTQDVRFSSTGQASEAGPCSFSQLAKSHDMKLPLGLTPLPSSPPCPGMSTGPACTLSITPHSGRGHSMGPELDSPGFWGSALTGASICIPKQPPISPSSASLSRLSWKNCSTRLILGFRTLRF